MRSLLSKSALVLLTASALGAAGLAFAHGDVVPQAVNTDGLPQVKGPLEENPYRANKDKKVVAKAVEIGSSAYNQNCARCHGLGAVSGGIAPDLRMLPAGVDGDEIFSQRIRHGSVRNGVTYMPPFEGTFSESAIWAIRSYLDSVHVDE
ncbi:MULTISPECIES: cytochrome c-550 PedF [Hydrocarboniphaga]|jgi:cytochrome c-550 PedF|uniref:Cytochrome c550 n=1 Tax=Hydrocarboniphaga effusa AP103 TaxID=1172194 RepID=I8I4L5_9GAMM|nr:MULTISPECIES: cytochrome c-550 PedF [Hydrocarboniphaga]EIT71196.1 cytochrome c550 [Hydrocarboniphaga effusa AP103]MDZ4079449.1 cytochrome c-550 PedF [Hydrocarboniphaga sp.]